jgi:hypothetical protein
MGCLSFGVLRALRRLSCLLLLCATSIAWADATTADPAATLRAKYTSLEQKLRANPFRQPLVLDSAESAEGLRGDIYAIVNFPFSVVRTGLSDPDHWCEVLLLHINTKYCHARVGPAGTLLQVNIGRKTPEDLGDTSRIDFNFSVVATTPEYLEVTLDAKDGPLGTSDYLILLQAMTLPNGRGFLHLRYAYSVNFGARLALATYLGTNGSDKVGFTVSGKDAAGQATYIGGVRGLVERNTMRYYLAIESYLGAVASAPTFKFENSLQSWFTAVERYPRQLHEMDRGEYLSMKRAEHERQKAVR